MSNHSRLFATDRKAFDPYDILDVQPGASLDEIRNSYIKLSKKYHPDRNPGDVEAEEKFIILTRAYRSLTEKIINQQANQPNQGEKKAEKDYDFTISPLGVESELPTLITTSDIFRRLVQLFCLCLLINLSYFMVYEAFSDFVKERYDNKRGKTEKKLADEAAERIRMAVIEEHKRTQELREAYKSSGVKRES